VAPIGHPVPITTIVDVALGEYPQVWAAGGIPHAVFPTSFAELVRLTGGTPAEVA
jgi:prolyl-tRNA editing enzyme YbaK/EbsC (Cys-tRNA(Pro) deacylase)